MKYSKLSAAVLLLLSPSSASLLKQKVQSLPALSRPDALATLKQDTGDSISMKTPNMLCVSNVNSPGSFDTPEQCYASIQTSDACSSYKTNDFIYNPTDKNCYCCQNSGYDPLDLRADDYWNIYESRPSVSNNFVKQQGKCRRTADGGYNLATARYVPTGAARADDLCMQECEASAACVAAEQGVHCHTFSEGEMFSGDGDTTDDVQCYIKTRWAGGTEEEERKQAEADAVAALWAAQAEADAQALIDAQAAADAQAILDAEAALAADMHSGGWGGKETGFCVDTAWEDVNDGVEQLDSVDYRDEDENLCLAQCGALATATACEIIYEYDSMGCYVHTSHAVARGNGADNHACWLRDHSMDGAASHIEHDADHVDEEALLWAAVEDAEHRLALAEDEFQAITDMLQDELPADVVAEITAAQTEAHIRLAIAQTEKDDLLAMAEEYSAAQEHDHDADQDAHDAVLAEIWAGLEVAEAKLAAAHDEVVALDQMEHFLGSAMNEEQAAELAIAQAVAETDLAMARDEVDAILQMALEYEAMMAAEHEHDHEGEHEGEGEGEGEGEPEPTPFDYLLRDIGTLRYDLLHICDAMYVDPANTPFCDEAYTVLDAIEATTHVAQAEPCPHHHEDHFHEE